MSVYLKTALIVGGCVLASAAAGVCAIMIINHATRDQEKAYNDHLRDLNEYLKWSEQVEKNRHERAMEDLDKKFKKEKEKINELFNDIKYSNNHTFLSETEKLQNIYDESYVNGKIDKDLLLKKVNHQISTTTDDFKSYWEGVKFSIENTEY